MFHVKHHPSNLQLVFFKFQFTICRLSHFLQLCYNKSQRNFRLIYLKYMVTLKGAQYTWEEL
jgi:hypothetical protein